MVKLGDNQILNLPVQMIAACSTLGEITPIRMRYEDGLTHQLLTVDIEEVVSAKELNFCGIKEIEYICRAVIIDMSYLIELRYNVLSHQWVLKRKLS